MSSIVRAARVSALLGPAGLVVSALSTVLIVRTLSQDVYADYVSVLALTSWTLLLAEAGGSVGFMRYLKEAAESGARGTLYLELLKRRLLIGALSMAGILVIAPRWAQWSALSPIVWNRTVFVMVGAIVAVQLISLLAYYGLLGAFQHRYALTVSQSFVIFRSLAVIGVALFSPRLLVLVSFLLAIALAEGGTYHVMLWRLFGSERQELAPSIVAASQRHGLVSTFDKVTSMIGGGSFLLLVLAPFHSRPQIAVLGVALDLVQKSLVIASVPMSSLVLPYLNQASTSSAKFSESFAKVTQISLLIFVPILGAIVVGIPGGVPWLFGERYAGAALLTLIAIIPFSFESWVRFVAVAGLMTLNRYRALLWLNAGEAVLVVVALAATATRGLIAVVIAMAIVKVLYGMGVLQQGFRYGLLARRHSPRGLGPVAVLAVVAGLGAHFALHGAWGHAAVVAGLAVYGFFLFVGIRTRVVLDNDVDNLLARLAGAHERFLRLMIPVRPSTSGHVRN